MALEDYYKLPESKWANDVYKELAKTDLLFEDCARLILLHPRLMTSMSYKYDKLCVNNYCEDQEC